MKVVICNRVYSMKFPSQDVFHTPVKGHTDSCSDPELPDRDEVRQFVLEHLQSRGIDLSRDANQAK